MSEQYFGVDPPLARLLLLASRWFDAVSREQLARLGWPRLSAGQTLFFAHLLPDGVSVAELARRLGNSRQATHQMVRGLVDLGFLRVEDDPSRRGGRLVFLAPRGHDLFSDSVKVLGDIENTLEPRHVQALRGALQSLRLE
ncbi:MarR family transcriptional regulator [Blastococcus sp. TF02-8]|uniref:MarR family winged helix-turn-helix transcriptional regulator n=1 Tax=Blastococcus sp. TF02-8 TaxID=2250574 RepID=UPI000DEC01BB|nr:MarR family transcriptional regulator [Blastococcus sp. TF02-8]RBY96892.1 MarR family transcriptional regulator [Blastococcus sp. TF02-8]